LIVVPVVYSLVDDVKVRTPWAVGLGKESHESGETAPVP
jgi:hypothetical protein